MNLENVLGYVCNPSSSKERDAASKRRLGNATSVTVLWTYVKTVQQMGETSQAGDVIGQAA